MSSNMGDQADEESSIQTISQGEVMNDETVGYLSIQIFKKLPEIPPKPSKSIFKVPENLRTMDEKAYEPCILAIGPYHRGKEQVKIMDEHKKWYLKNLLERRKETNVERYVHAIKALENDARTFYAEDCDIKKMSSDDFVEMMLLDGCFIVELLRRYVSINLWRAEDFTSSNSFTSLGCDKNKLARDLLLVENQIPFSVVETLFDITKTDKEKTIEQKIGNPERSAYLVKMIFHFFASSVLHSQSLRPIRNYPNKEEIKHLLSLIHICWFSSSESVRRRDNNIDSKKRNNKENWRFISCATELREAGIGFKAVSTAERLSDIKFDDGTMKIPKITITDQSESVFKNLIVYEQSFSDEKTVTNYMKFMDCLINSSMDVKLLCKRNILHNRLGDHEVVADVFNRLGCIFTPSGPNNYYCEILAKVNRHCKRRRNVWIAILKLRYFNSPWQSISVVAAVVLLVLTLVQTVYSVLAYYFK